MCESSLVVNSRLAKIMHSILTILFCLLFFICLIQAAPRKTTDNDFIMIPDSSCPRKCRDGIKQLGRRCVQSGENSIAEKLLPTPTKRVVSTTTESDVIYIEDEGNSFRKQKELDTDAE